MTRPLSDVLQVLELADAGLSKRAISIRTGISRASIREWLAEPNRALARRISGNGLDCLGTCEPWRQLDSDAYSYVLGMYLGDGCISRHPRAYRLRISCDDKYPAIKTEVAQAIQALVPSRIGHVQCEGCTEISAYSCHWPCFFPQHGPGMKHERRIILEPWQREIVERDPRPFIRGLIHSDGWRGMNVAVRRAEHRVVRRYYTRYEFTNRSQDIRDLFCWALDLLGVHWTQANRWHISVARRKDVHYLDTFVGPKR